ncbi:MAG TPA: hypothetical protein VD861_00995 [Pyrinomonadaceae bacterium]|nr:hypothetical protein [Pyrinomonadaceae bacterium]
MNDFERLDQTGFIITDTTINYAGTRLTGNYGSGYKDTAIIGLPLREWTVQIDVLPALDRYSIVHDGGRETRADYLWNFYCRQMDADNLFRIIDQKDGKEYLVEFVDEQLTYEVLTRVLYATGLQLKQRRVKGVEGVSAPGAGINPDSI